MERRRCGPRSSNASVVPRRRVDTADDWERVIAAATRLQRIVDGAVLVGGSGAALHVHHRFSYDDDHVVADLRDHFDEILTRLEEAAGWISARVQRPVQILGSLDGIDTGIRQQRRTAPLETELVATAGGPVRIPSLREMLRIKSWLAVTRNATRDYVDIAALATRLRELDGPRAPIDALLSLDALYPQHNAESAIRQLTKQLAEPRPYDFESDAFGELRGLAPPWTSWKAVVASIRDLAAELAIAHADETR